MKRVENLSKKELSKLGIINDDNYYKIFNRRKKGATIKIIYPYGIDHSDYYIDFYINSLITFIDEHFNKQKLDIALSYELFFNKSVITIDMVDSYNLNIALGVFFNTIKKEDLLNMLLEHKMNTQYNMNINNLSNFNMMSVDNINMETLVKNAYDDLINDTIDLKKIRHLQKHMINELTPIVVIESNQRHVTLDTHKNNFFKINERKITFDTDKILSTNDNVVIIDKEYNDEIEYIKDYFTCNLYEILFSQTDININLHIVKEINNRLIIFLYTDNNDKNYIKDTLKLIHKDINIFNFYKKIIKLKLKDNFNKVDTVKGLSNHIIANSPVYESFDELVKDALVMSNILNIGMEE